MVHQQQPPSRISPFSFSRRWDDNVEGTTTTTTTSPSPPSIKTGMMCADDLPFAKEITEARQSGDKARVKELIQMRKMAMKGDIGRSPMSSYAPTGAAATTTTRPRPPPSTAPYTARPTLPAHLRGHPKSDLLQSLMCDLGFSEVEAVNATRRESTLEKAANWIYSHPDLAQSPLSGAPPASLGGGAKASSYRPLRPRVLLDGKAGQIQHRLMEVGMDEEEAKRQALEACKRHAQVDAAVAWVFGQHEASQPIMKKDPISLEEVNVEEAYLVDCGHDHWSSYESLFQGIMTYIRDKLLPSCPQLHECHHVLGQQEVENIINLWFNGDREPSDEEIEVLKLRRGKIHGVEGWVSDEVVRLYNRSCFIKAGMVECPQDGCGVWVQPPVPGQQFPCTCEGCAFTYCTRCTRPYHYDCDCDQVMTLTRQWVEWQQNGLGQYLEEMARQDANYAQAVADFNKRREEHAKDVEIAAKNLRTLQEDEQYKARTARYCPNPNCRRVIERITGCDYMRCGQDNYGGNVQNGCGTAFQWPTAQPYVPDMGDSPEVPAFTEAEPAKAASHHHHVDGVPVTCSDCNQEVVGPLARCINCPGNYVRCLACQSKPHADGNHVFRLDMGTD